MSDGQFDSSANTLTLPKRAGLGFKPEYLVEILETKPNLGFVEIHAENYMVDGGPFHQHLTKVRSEYPLSIHGVGLSIGGTTKLDRDHLCRLKSLLDRYQPSVFSEHLAWCNHGGVFYNDLLPLPYNGSTLHRVCEHIDEAQDVLGVRMLIENPSTYVEFESSTWDEADFISEMTRRTGCGLLLDLNNAYISAVNHKRDLGAYMNALPLDAVGEIHLAGFSEDLDAAGSRLLIDAHASAIDVAVWDLYASAIDQLGKVATLIERDQNIPTLDEMMLEVSAAQMILDSCEALGNVQVSVGRLR